ncbi:MAG: ROK family protein [Actinomycetota bacterium]
MPTIGLDIGGTKVLGVVLDDDGTIVRERREPSPVGALDPLVEACASIVASLDAPDAPDAAVGVGAAGLVDLDGRVMYAPNIPGLRNAPLRDAIGRATGRAVVVDNDANVAALGEVVYGAARGAHHALMVTLGTGIGGGIILDGRIHRGAHGFAAEIGHVTIDRAGPQCACGEIGHWEAIASGNALGRMARELVKTGRGKAILEAADGDVSVVSGEEVAQAARAGDRDALELVAQYADNVALGLANLANILDPERIVIAGGIVTMGALLFDPLCVAFESHLEGTEYRPTIPLVSADLGEHAGAVGAAVLARDLRTSGP